MSRIAILVVVVIALFGGIVVAGKLKKGSIVGNNIEKVQSVSIEPTLAQKEQEELSIVEQIYGSKQESHDSRLENQKISASPQTKIMSPPMQNDDDFPAGDQVMRLFTTGNNKLPIVETLKFSTSVPWLKGKMAWIADYAAHYNTSRHFIARSLNGKPDYNSQKVSQGSRFNVFRSDKQIHFYLLIDVSRCKMGFYYHDLATDERVLLKTYKVGLGRLDPMASSGVLTPLGTYSLGSKVAIYKPGVMGYFQEQKTEMVRIFGTRWIPFGEEVENCSSPAKGFGIHGAPWEEDMVTGNLVENKDCIGKYDSDGCIRLALDDMEEIYSIVITKPTFVVIVKDFKEAKLPGKEVSTPSM